MNKILLLVILLMPLTLALPESETRIVHTFNEDWEDYTEYNEVYRGKWAKMMRKSRKFSNTC